MSGQVEMPSEVGRSGSQRTSQKRAIGSATIVAQAQKMRLLLLFVKCETSWGDADDVLRERSSDHDVNTTSVDES